MDTEGEKGTLISPGAASEPDPSGSAYASDRRSAPPTLSMMSGLSHGQLLAGRFRVKELVQSGGMGDVYLAEDLYEQGWVAVKTLRPGAASPERFEREALRLSELQHPGIPRYITHDLVTANMPYLVMEWLDGVELSVHMRRGRLSIKAAVNVVRQAADAVSAAHRQGVVHRDINPNNLFLVGDDPSQVRVLDFGVARLEDGDPPLTSEGSQIGTPGYMAPEQIEARAAVTPAADVFSLGCVLYEAVTGTRAFYAPTIRELLTRMVSETPALPRTLQPALPEALDALIMQMLCKGASERPQDAGEVVRLIDALPALDDVAPRESHSSQAPSVEQYVTSLIVLRALEEGQFEKACRAAEPHGMRARRGDDGTVILSTTGAGTAADHATVAARCALSVQRATRAPQIALATGLLQRAGETLSGRALDTALVSLLLKDGEPVDALPQGPQIWLDENTATLLDSRFDVRGVDQGYLLKGLRETYEPTRTVLGRKTRCVGRKRELSTLEATVLESAQDSVASAVLITGPPGIGKSRLAGEMARLARRALPGVQVLRGGAEPLHSGSPYAALIDAIERACRMRDGEPESVRRQKLQSRLAPLLSGDDLHRVGEFMGNLLGISPEREPSAQLEAALRDALLRGDQTVRALEDWLRAETRAHPVVLILDDFHWGDLPTVRFVDSVLRKLSECPLVIVTLARPELHEMFPKLWFKRGITELKLSGLSRRAAQEMIEEVLGPTVSKDIIDRIIARGQGNPFWIEELLRAEGAGQGDNVPDRIVLLAQSRIEQQSQDERFLLKAASVFGRQFWLGGAQAVLGPQGTQRRVDKVLADLVENEFVIEQQLSRIGGQKEYQFASGLLRDAAYSLLGEEEQETGHLRAADWLEKTGDSDPLAVALHFTLGGEPDRAKMHYLVAAEQALSGDDLDAAISCAEEGLSAGARGKDAVRLRLVQAEAHKWRGDNAQAFHSAQAAFARAEEGTAEWFRAAAESAVAAGKTGKKESSLALAMELLESTPQKEALSDFGIALSRVATQLVLGGHHEQAEKMLARVSATERRLEPDPHVMGFYNEAKAVLALATDDPLGRITFAERAVEHFEDAGDLRNACLARLSQGFAEVEFGATDDAVVTLNRAREVAESMGLSNSVPVARAQYGRALGRLGRLDEATAHLEAAAHAFDRQKNVRLAGMARAYLAEVQLRAKQPEAALQSAERAAAILEPMPPMRRVAMALKAAIGVVSEVRASPADVEHWAREALNGLGPDDRLPVGESLVRLGAASGLFATGHRKEAEELVMTERVRVSGQVASMPEARAQQFLFGDPARALITHDRAGLTSEDDRFDYAGYLMKSVRTSHQADHADSPQFPSLAEIERITLAPDPVLRNLWITQNYHVLSRELASVVCQQNVTWASFACWASKTAGVSIRNEELPRFVARELGLASRKLKGIGRATSKLLELFRLGRPVRDAAVAVLVDVSREIASGNRKVHEELAPLFAHFVALMKTDPRQEEVTAFVEALAPGPIEQGGQELLKRAFLAWYHASRTESETLRAQLILRGNCQIGLHEQTRLQPHIQCAMDAPVETLWRRKVQALFPTLVGAPLAFLVSLLVRPFLSELTHLWRKVATRYALNLALPGGNEIPLSDDLPQRPDTFPADLKSISDPKTEALLEQFDRDLHSTSGSGANNWATLSDRMGFIVELFRSKQQDLSLLGEPFSPDDERALAEGRLPPSLD